METKYYMITVRMRKSILHDQSGTSHATGLLSSTPCIWVDEILITPQSPAQVMISNMRGNAKVMKEFSENKKDGYDYLTEELLIINSEIITEDEYNQLK